MPPLIFKAIAFAAIAVTIASLLGWGAWLGSWSTRFAPICYGPHRSMLDGVEHGIASLRNDLPDIVAGAVGKALRTPRMNHQGN
jgi:hypothetical protein